jgi:hypothetical protein
MMEIPVIAGISRESYSPYPLLRKKRRLKMFFFSSGGIPSLFSGGFIGNVIVCLVFVPVMLYFLTPVIERHELSIRRYWD